MKRPISPHLTIYKPQIGSIMSIFERITGIIIFVLSLIMLMLMVKSDIYYSYYNFYTVYFELLKTELGFTIGSIILHLYILSISYHFWFSLRYVFWSITGGVDSELFVPLELKTLEAENEAFYFVVYGTTFIIWMTI